MKVWPFECCACLCVCVCVWACMCLTAALSPAAKGSSGETHPLLFALHREDCFQRVFRKGNPSIVASVDPYQFFLYVFLHRYISSTDFDFHTAAILKFLPSPFFFSASLYICHVCLLPLALFLIIACFPVLLDQLLKVSVLCTAERGASWKRQAVRMTSSCRKAFYVSLCVLTLSIALLTSACQLRSLCDIMIK